MQNAIRIMGGFGALRAMADTLKSNRELLKANKKTPFDRGNHHGRTLKIVFHDKRCDEATLLVIRASNLKEAREDRKKRLIAMLLTSMAGAGIVLILLIGF